MKTVCLAIPPVNDLYPWKAARTGLEALGLQVIMGGDRVLDADVLVTWSPWNGSRRQALQFNYARASKPVIVMENGWLTPIKSVPYYQVAFNGWNGTGTFYEGSSDRWYDWGVRQIPFTNRTGGHWVIIGQRGHPSDDRTAPPDWHITVKPPGIEQTGAIRRGRESTRPLLQDLRGACQCHVWTSNAASWAILEGVPVIQHGPNLMVGALASRPGEPLFRGDTEMELDRLAWAQWNSEEIASGRPFAILLRGPNGP